jgi:hypothetical protein
MAPPTWINALGASRPGAAQHSQHQLSQHQHSQHSQPRQQRGSAPSPTASVASGRSGVTPAGARGSVRGLPALEMQRGSVGGMEVQRGGLGSVEAQRGGLGSLGGMDAQRGSLGSMDAQCGSIGEVDAQLGSLGGFPALDKMALFRERWAALAPAVQCEQRCQQSELSALQGEVLELRRELGHVSSALKALEEQVGELQRQLRQKQQHGQHGQQHGHAEKQEQAQSSQQLRGHRVEELSSTSVLEAVRRLVLGLDGGVLDLSSEPQYATCEGEQEAHNAEPKPLAPASQTQLSEDDSVSTASWRTLKRRRSEHLELDVSQGSQATVYSSNRSVLD